MWNRTTGKCSRICQSLQSLHDAGEKPRGRTAEHVAHCRNCAAFQAYLEGLSRNLRDTLDQSAARLPAPDYAELFAHPPERRIHRIRRVAIPAIAAAFIALAIPSLIITVSSMRERAAMQKTMASFVDDLFAFSSGQKAHPAEKGPDSSGQALDSLLDDLAAD